MKITSFQVVSFYLCFKCCHSVSIYSPPKAPKIELSDLNFGIELEYIFPESALVQTDDQKIVGLVEILKQHGVPGKFYGYEESHKVGITPQWKIVPDESLTNGFEIVSPPINNIDQVRKVLDAMKKYGSTVSETTDFHVHVDATNRSVEEVRNVLKNFIVFESTMDLAQPTNHRGNSNVWMQSNSAHFDSPASAYSTFDECETLQCLYFTNQPATGLGSRVHKLNLAEHPNSVTLEFRGHHGTLESGEVASWVKFLTVFVRRSFEGVVADSKAGRMSPTDRMAYMFDLLLDNDKELIKNYIHRVFDQSRKSFLTAEDSIFNKPVLSPYEGKPMLPPYKQFSSK